MAKKGSHKTTLTIHVGTYGLIRMSFGLMNAPITFRLGLDTILNKYTWKSCLVYMDDIIVFSNNSDQHLKNSNDIFSTLYAAGVFLMLEKCHCLTTKVKYLGLNTMPHKLSIMEARAVGLKSIEHPRTLTRRRAFLCMYNFHCRFDPTIPALRRR